MQTYTASHDAFPPTIAAILLLQALEDVQAELDALSGGCNAINAALEADRASSADLLSESDRLQHELAVSETRSGLVQNFFEQYQLSGKEISALQVRICSQTQAAQPLLPKCRYADTLECRMQTLVKLSLKLLKG